MTENFDLVVVGGGPGGYVAAIRAAQLGMKTALVEREHLGGICLNWGCIPTKALLRTSQLYHDMQRAEEFGLKASGLSYDPKKVVARSRAVAKQLSGGVAHLLRKNKVTVFDGEARLTWRAEPKVTAWELRISERLDPRGDYELRESGELAGDATSVEPPIGDTPLRVHLLGRDRGGRLVRRTIVSGLTRETWGDRWQRRATAS